MRASRAILRAGRVIALGMLLVPRAAAGQGRDCLLMWRLRAFTLQNREYFDPLIAEPRAANIKVVFPAWADTFRHGAPGGELGRRVWDISLGKEIPIHGCEKGDGRTRRLAPGEWGVGLWLPISFHMVEDLADESAPIVNTDYRFAGMLKAQWALRGSRYLGVRYVFAGHESTHLGDEFSLAAQRRGDGFERINVSYEYWELAGSFEQQARRSAYRLRAGAITLFHPDRGYYSADTAETNGRVVLGSTNAVEPYVGAEWVSSVAIRPPLLDLAPYVSADVRLKTVYDYHKSDADAAEDREWSVNVMVGLKRPEKRYLERGVPNLFAQFYHGVNPHGQFREQRSWSMVGLGIHVPM
jgi:hypothetical protein